MIQSDEGQQKISPRRLTTGTNGFTLLEVLIAILVLTIGLMGMEALTVAIIKGNKQGNRMTTATTLAQDKMEAVRILGYSGMPSSDTDVTEGYNTISNYPFHKRVTSTYINNPDTGMKKVTVTVYWDSDAHSVDFQTILAQ